MKSFYQLYRLLNEQGSVTQAPMNVPQQPQAPSQASQAQQQPAVSPPVGTHPLEQAIGKFEEFEKAMNQAAQGRPMPPELKKAIDSLRGMLDQGKQQGQQQQPQAQQAQQTQQQQNTQQAQKGQQTPPMQTQQGG
jgi:hypothetical protein